MTACRFIARDEPRALLRHHLDDCADDECRGCEPCPEPHCRVCGRVHVEQTCAECVGSTREDLHAIAQMCGALTAEAIHRGVESEAMTLLGPAADPEAWGFLTASLAVGRLPRGYLSEADGELHPLFCLGTWDMTWRAELEHDDAKGRLTVAVAFDYLDRQLTYMAGYEHVPFEDFAADLRRCRAHLEAVLHDSSTGIRANVPCFECGDDLERQLGKEGFEDVWTCRNRRCPRKTYTVAEFNFALRAKLEEATA